MVARYLTSRPGREQARPAWCSQGFSAPHCERLARNITDVGQVRVPCRDRRQGASRIEHGKRNMFLSQHFLEGCQPRFLRDCKIQAQRVAFQDLDCTMQQDTLATSKDGTDVALPAIPHEMKQLHRDAPYGRLRRCCGAVLLVTVAWTVIRPDVVGC
jgi:hypothetical protein